MKTLQEEIHPLIENRQGIDAPAWFVLLPGPIAFSWILIGSQQGYIFQWAPLGILDY